MGQRHRQKTASTALRGTNPADPSAQPSSLLSCEKVLSVVPTPSLRHLITATGADKTPSHRPQPPQHGRCSLLPGHLPTAQNLIWSPVLDTELPSDSSLPPPPV